MKKQILLFLVIALAGLAVYFGLNYFVAPTESLQPIYLIPKDAIYVVELDRSIDAWERISSHPMWAHLQTNAYFAELTASANALDSLVKNNPMLKDLVGERTILASAHMYKANDYDFVFVVDLQRESKLPIESVLENLAGAGTGYVLTSRTYKEHRILELYDKKSRQTLYLAIIKNLLVGSYQSKLLEAGISQMEEPFLGREVPFLEVSRAIPNSGLARVYLQYNYLDEYMRCYMDEEDSYVKDLSKQLLFTGLDCDLDDKGMLRMTGFTNLNDTLNSYLLAMMKSGKGGLDITKVAPQRTAFYMGLGFDSFLGFFENLEKLMQETDADYNGYIANVQKVEKFLKINMKEHFMSWIDDELAFVQTQPGRLGKRNEFAVILKAKSGAEAKEKLGYLVEQIGKKTPVKFREVKYKDYAINFLSVKGFFKMMLGGFFAGLEKLYYSIIEDFVIFSNHPQTLKSIIDDYEEGKTLANFGEFQQFKKEFKDESNVFIYVQTAVMHQNLREFVSNETWKDMSKNKPYIVCFSHVGFQLAKDGNMMATRMASQYKDPTAVSEELKDLAESQSVVASDGMAINPNGESLADSTMQSIDEAEMVALDDISPDDLDAKEYQETFEGTEQVRFTVRLKNGLKHGEYIEYYPNGRVRLKGDFKDDQRDGTWREFDESGKRIGKIKYKNGQQVN